MEPTETTPEVEISVPEETTPVEVTEVIPVAAEESVM